jgi:hypothetical protein
MALNTAEMIFSNTHNARENRIARRLTWPMLAFLATFLTASHIFTADKRNKLRFILGDSSELTIRAQTGSACGGFPICAPAKPTNWE